MSGFDRVSIALLVVSDRASSGAREDLCEPVIRSFLESRGLTLGRVSITADEKDEIGRTLAQWADSGDYDLVLSAGGTGLSPRDVTPEATRPILDREIPGIPEAMRAASVKISRNAVLSRGLAGMRGSVMIINLPGSPKAAVENLEAVLDAVLHGIAKAKGDPSDCAPHPGA